MKISVSPTNGLKGEITIPPDKSISHRKAMFSAINECENIIENYSLAADPQSTLSCIRSLGIPVAIDGKTVKIKGSGRSFPVDSSIVLDCGNSGTTMRLMAGIVAGAGVSATFVGDESLSNRPMKRVILPLEEMKAEIQSQNGMAPLVNVPKKLSAISYNLPVASAQVKSCVLLAGLFADGITSVIESEQSRDHTERMLSLPKKEENGKTIISSSRDLILPDQSGLVPGDFSAAAFWLVAASIIPGSTLVLKNVGLNPTRTATIDILLRMGADIQIRHLETEGEPYGDIVVRSSELKATEIFPHEIANAIDEIPILSVAMSFAYGESHIRGAAELRVKETDRIDAVSKMLQQANISHSTFSDGLNISGNRNHSFSSGNFSSFHDHRIAMSSAILSLRGLNSSWINGADAAAISYPDFWKDLARVSQ